MLPSASVYRKEWLSSSSWLRAIMVTREFRVSLFLTIAIVAIGFIADVTNLSVRMAIEQRQHMGGEYYNIARALVDGRGFSDPFAEPTGPTAWMPPLYPFLLSACLFLTHSRAMTGDIVLLLSNLTYLAAGLTLYTVAVSAARRVPPIFVLLFYLIWMIVFRFWFFQLTHDIWLQVFEVTLVMLLLYRSRQTGVVRMWLWGLLGGLLVLSSPALTFAFVCLILFLALFGKNRRAWVGAIAIMVAIAAPWTIRNAVVFHRLIPIKSNLYFDAYQGNVLDVDGVYDNETMARHPFGSPMLRFQYARLGESRFIDVHRQQFYKLVAEKPGVYALKVGRRAIAALAWYASLGAGDDGGTLVAERMCYLFPLPAFLVLMMLRGPNRMFVACCGIFSLAFLSPYIFIAYYIRYALPLTPIIALFVFLAADEVVLRISKIARRTAQSVDLGAERAA